MNFVLDPQNIKPMLKTSLQISLKINISKFVHHYTSSTFNEIKMFFTQVSAITCTENDKLNWIYNDKIGTKAKNLKTKKSKHSYSRSPVWH